MKLNKSLVSILFIILFSSILILFNIQGIIDQFLSQSIAFTTFYLDASHFPSTSPIFSPKYIMGTIANYLIISKIANLSPESIQYLPIPGMILPIIYYSVCKKFTKSGTLGLTITALMMLTVGPSNFFAVWTHAWGFLLFLIIILLNIHIYNKKEPRTILLLIIVFVSINFYSYTAEMWAISLISLFNLTLIISGYFTGHKYLKNKLITSLNFLYIVIFFGFNEIIYGGYLAHGRFEDSFKHSILLFLSNISPFHKTSDFVEYASFGESHLLLTIFGLTYYFLLLFVICLPIAISIIKASKIRVSSNSPNDLNMASHFRIVLIAVAIVDIIIYSMRGLFTLRTILFIYPLVALISLNQLKVRKSYKHIFLSFIFIVAFIHLILGAYYETLPVDYTKSNYLESSADWFLNKSTQYDALADLRTGYKYSLYGASKKTIFGKHFFDINSYKQIVEPSYHVNKTQSLHEISDYVLVNIRVKYIQTDEWGNYYPFNNYLTEINKNHHISKIYNDGSIWIFKT